MEKRTTLSDIARAAGVTPTTVQRALKGIGGVSEEQRLRIRQIADEMNYHPNALASVLKRGTLKLAAVLPDSENENRYYASCLWDGLEQFLAKNTMFQIECYKISYDRTPKNQVQAMVKMLEECGDDLDGVITMGDNHPGFLAMLDQLDQRQVPYVFVGTDYSDCGRLCSVQACNDVAGKLAADLFLNFMKIKGHGTILVTGDFGIQDQEQNAIGFETEIRQQTGTMEILKLSNLGGIEATARSIAKYLNADLDIVGIYSCSARNTLAICRAVEAADSDVPTVGSDVFAENAQLIKAGKLQAIIHKRHYDQSYHAMQILVEYLIKKQKPENSVQFIMPVVVMNGNIAFYEKGLIHNSGEIFL